MPKERFVFSSGRLWDEAKNIATVESAAALMSWPVYVAGSTCHPNGGASTLRSCVGLGQLSEQQMQTWYSKSSIYVLPAKYEPFGLSALEAALSGCALVLGDIPSLREIWGDAALYVPPSDAEALALAVNALSARPEMLKLLAWRAHSRATRFTTARMGDGYLRVYEQAGRRGEGTQAKCAS
jgi:glycosyltransferase involved in cell wall biosynthesis